MRAVNSTPDEKMRRVRRRLEKHFGERSFVLASEPDGWRWDIPQRPLRTRRAFATVEQALDHADRYTRLWWPEEEKEEANDPGLARGAGAADPHRYRMLDRRRRSLIS